MNAPLPKFVQLEPVGQCNLRCRMCPIQFRNDGSPGGPPAFMSYELFCRLLDGFPALTELHLQGLGEPLMHPRFFDMVRHACARGIEVSTNTNMTVLSDRRAEQCVSSGLARLHVSLDGATAQTYEYIRERSRFERVLCNLRRLAETKVRLASARPEIHLVAVAMRRNLGELPGIVRLAHELGIAHVSVQHLCHDFGEASLPPQYRPMRAFVEDETLANEDAERVRVAFDEARSVAAGLGVALRLPNVRPRPRGGASDGRPRCDWPWRGAYVSYSGEAMPCCMVATPDRINFGSMAKEAVADVWSNEAYTEFRRRLESDDPPEICRSCAVYNGTF